MLQRRGALRITSAYPTVSEPAVLVFASVIPIDLLAFEWKRISGVGGSLSHAEVHSHTMEDWQECWEQEGRGQWTARLIVDFREWVERIHK